MPSFWANTLSACRLKAEQEQYLFLMQIVQVSDMCIAVAGICRPLLDLILESGCKEGAGSHASHRILGLMMGIFRLSVACQLGGISHKHRPHTGQCFEQLSFPPDREQRHSLQSHLYQNVGTHILHMPLPRPAAPLQFTTAETEQGRNWKRGKSEWVIFL